MQNQLHSLIQNYLSLKSIPISDIVNAGVSIRIKTGHLLLDLEKCQFAINYIDYIKYNRFSYLNGYTAVNLTDSLFIFYDISYPNELVLTYVIDKSTDLNSTIPVYTFDIKEYGESCFLTQL